MFTDASLILRQWMVVHCKYSFIIDGDLQSASGSLLAEKIEYTRYWNSENCRISCNIPEVDGFETRKTGLNICLHFRQSLKCHTCLFDSRSTENITNSLSFHQDWWKQTSPWTLMARMNISWLSISDSINSKGLISFLYSTLISNTAVV